MGFWFKKLDTDEGETYNVYRNNDGSLDVHRSCVIPGWGERVANADSMRDAISSVESKTDSSVTKVRSW